MSVLRPRSSTLSSAGSKSAAANGFNLAGWASQSAGRLLAYSGLHLYEEIVLGFPLPLRERDRVRGKGSATSLLIQTKNALRRSFSCRIGRTSTWRACREAGVSDNICCNLGSLTKGEARITR